MKKLLLSLFALLLIVGANEATAQNKKLERAYDKQYKQKIKEYKSEGWKVAGTSKTLEVALMEHYDKLKDGSNQEFVGEVSRCNSINVCKQQAYNNALIAYATLAGSTLKGRVAADMNNNASGDGSEEFDKMYAAYERLVEQEIKGVLTESYAIVKDGKNGKQYKVFFVVNEDKASSARIRALERAAKESDAAQKYATKISDFVRKGFEPNSTTVAQ